MKSTDGSADRAPPPPRRSQKSTAVYRKGHRGRCFSCGKYGHKARDCWGPYVHRRSAPSADVVNVHNFHFNGNVNGVSPSSIVNVHNYYFNFNFKGPVSISLNGGFLAIGGAMPSSSAPARACAPTTPARIAAPPTVDPGVNDKKQEQTNVKMEDADEEIVRWDL
ncbi:hypothetical protein KJ359_005546 [Pestalotiopsis sp. 9143b]|nr:hypothetical protein KJ359_005546 [Pestalotiopsis sp. 9143b]